MTKTIFVLAIAAAFVAGAAVFGLISDYEAEAAPKKPKPLPPIIGPVNATLAQLNAYQEQLAIVHFNFVETAEGVSTSPGFTDDEIAELSFALEIIEDEAEEIRKLAEDTRLTIPVIKIP